MDAFIMSSLPPHVVGRSLTAGSLRSPDITPVHRYFEPIRHPLVFSPFPVVPGYRTYLAPEISSWDEEGFSSCSACPCHRTIAPTPPESVAVSASFRLPLLPSPYGCRLGFRGFSLSGPPMRSLSLRSGNSLASLTDYFVNGLQIFGFPLTCHSSYGVLAFPPGRTTPY